MAKTKTKTTRKAKPRAKPVTATENLSDAEARQKALDEIVAVTKRYRVNLQARAEITGDGRIAAKLEIVGPFPEEPS